MPVVIALAELTIDLTIQPRKVPINPDHADEIAAAVRAGQEMPPVRVFRTPDGKHVLTRGFHRCEGYRLAGKTHIPAEIREGTHEDAALDAAASAPEHQTLKFSSEDKRNAVSLVLKIRPQWSDRMVADHVGVSNHLVSDVRREVGDSPTSTAVPTKRVGKDGKSYTIQPTKPKQEKPGATKAKPTAKAEAGEGAGPAGDGAGGGPADGGAESPDGGHAAGDTGAAEAPPVAAKSRPVPTVDAWGIPIQEHAAEAFKAVPKFKELIGLLRTVRGELTALCESPGGRLLLRRCQFVRADNKAGGRWVLADLDNAIGVMEDTTPAHTDCPYHFNTYQPHAGEGRPCPLCANHRVTGNLKRFQVPPELLALMRRHYGLPEASNKEVG